MFWTSVCHCHQFGWKCKQTWNRVWCVCATHRPNANILNVVIIKWITLEATSTIQFSELMLECERFVYRLCTPLQCAIHTCETCFNCNYRSRSYLHIFRSRYSFSFWLYSVLRTETLFNVVCIRTSCQTDRADFRNAERIPLCRWRFFIRERARRQLKWFSIKHKQLKFDVSDWGWTTAVLAIGWSHSHHEMIASARART